MFLDHRLKIQVFSPNNFCCVTANLYTVTQIFFFKWFRLCFLKKENNRNARSWKKSTMTYNLSTSDQRLLPLSSELIARAVVWWKECFVITHFCTTEKHILSYLLFQVCTCTKIVYSYLERFKGHSSQLTLRKCTHLFRSISDQSKFAFEQSHSGRF